MKATTGGNSGVMFWASPIGQGVAIAIGATVLGVVVYFGLVRPFTNKIGLTESKEDKADKLTISKGEKQEYWSPRYWKSYPQKLTISEERVYQMTNALRDALTSWDTDEEAVYGAFRQLGTKADISKLADVYQIAKGRDLYGVLVDEMDTDELATLQNILNNYIKG